MSDPPAPDAAPAANWSERGLGRRWQYFFFNSLIRTLGKRPAYHMAYMVTFWYVLFYPGIRARTEFYLRRRFPGHRSGWRRFVQAWRLIRTFGCTLVDIAAFDILGKSSLQASCPDHDQLMRLCADKRGMIMVNSHLGSWQLGLAALENMPKRIALVMLPDPRVQAMLDRHRARIIDPRLGVETMVQMQQALEQGDILCIMGDRVLEPQQTTVSVPFLGSELRMPLTPFRLASTHQVPIFILLTAKTGFNDCTVRLADIYEVPAGLGRKPQAYAPYARRFAACMEKFVAEYPWQFFNFYDLWNDVRS